MKILKTVLEVLAVIIPIAISEMDKRTNDSCASKGA